jgi:3',5'-cyclic AMP phosphodiesterase CpdA
MPMPLSVLHLSDLHRDPANPISNQVLLDSLERDRDRYATKEDPRIEPPNLIIVSGDVVQGVKHGTPDAETKLRQQYDEAAGFLNELADRFVAGDKQRVIVVPGNHDVSDQKFRESLKEIDIAGRVKKALVAELFRLESPFRWSWEEFALYEIADFETYRQRLTAFNDFYSRFYDGQRLYPTDPSKQFDTFDFPDLGITIIGFCSCHNNDLLNKQGAIHPDCIAAAGKHLRDIGLSHNPLRIAVWHHNTEGPPIQVDYMDPDTVQNLIDGGFSLGFHGHQHRPQFLDTRFRHGPDRRITVISAGTLCGGAAFRFGRAYNIVEIDIDTRKGRLHLREMQNDQLHMPIWGARSLPPNQTSYLDFAFDPPPEPFVKADRKTVMLTQAQGMYDKGDFHRAAELFSPLAAADPLARRLLLQSLIRLGDGPAIIAAFDPPRSAAEAIALMDALWNEARRDRLAQLLQVSAIKESDDGSVIELRNKYAARLK